MNCFNFIAQKTTEALEILSRKLQIYKMTELTDEQAEVIIKNAQYMSEITTLTFQEALDKEIERLKQLNNP